jgi:parallel beta-helix repeat protein
VYVFANRLDNQGLINVSGTKGSKGVNGANGQSSTFSFGGGGGGGGGGEGGPGGNITIWYHSMINQGSMLANGGAGGGAGTRGTCPGSSTTGTRGLGGSGGEALQGTTQGDGGDGGRGGNGDGINGLAGAAGSTGPITLLTTNYACGDTITSSTTLEQDMSCPGQTALIINADNVVLDCNGYTIDSNDTAGTSGVYISGDSNFTIRNCTISDFSYGINFLSSYGYIQNNDISSSAYSITATGGTGTTIIEDNYFHDSPNYHVFLYNG